MTKKELRCFRLSLWKILALSVLMIFAVALLIPAKAHAAIVYEKSFKMNPNSWKQLSVRAPGEAGIEWGSSNLSICVVSNDGTVQSLSNGGSCYIYAKVNGENTHAWNVTVRSMEMKQSNIMLVRRRGSKQVGLTPSVARRNAVWSTSNRSVAVVNGSGVVSPRGEGTAIITASWCGVTASCTVQVFAANPTSLNRLNPPRYNRQKVLLIGSTLFDRWTSFQNAFGSTRVINNAFTQASISDFSSNSARLITNYKPKAVVFSLGTVELHELLRDNEDAASECAEMMQKLIDKVHKKSKKTKIFFASIPLYPGRSPKVWDRIKDYNKLMKAYCKSHSKYCTYLKLSENLMKGEKPNAAYFAGKTAGENQYLTSKGYAVVKKVVVNKVKKAIRR